MLAAKSTREEASIVGATVPCWLSAMAASAVSLARGTTWLTTNTIGRLAFDTSATVPPTALRSFGSGRTGTTAQVGMPDH